MKAAILSIGTELTTGQILNRNAHWISGKLKALGILTSVHTVVPDDRALISEALRFCEDKADLLFVTGGLGPTTDDFTRDLVLEWSGKKSFFHEDSWQHVQNRLNSRGIPVREFQRQQCYYPEGAEVLANRNGTANAFHFIHRNKKVFVLPGPPNEIEAVWTDFIAQKMTSLSATIDPWLTLSWDCLGQGESEIAFHTERALEGSGLEIGYRVHLPFVEVKVSYQKSQWPKISAFVTKLDQELAPFVALKNGQDAAELLSNCFVHFKEIAIVDSLTGCHLMNRLFPFLRTTLEQKKFSYSVNKDPNSKANLILEIHSTSHGTCQVSLKRNSQTRAQTYSSPYLKLLMKDRERQYFTEMALLFWLRELSH